MDPSGDELLPSALCVPVVFVAKVEQDCVGRYEREETLNDVVDDGAVRSRQHQDQLTRWIAVHIADKILVGVVADDSLLEAEVRRIGLERIHAILACVVFTRIEYKMPVREQGKRLTGVVICDLVAIFAEEQAKTRPHAPNANDAHLKLSAVAERMKYTGESSLFGYSYGARHSMLCARGDSVLYVPCVQ